MSRRAAIGTRLDGETGSPALTGGMCMFERQMQAWLSVIVRGALMPRKWCTFCGITMFREPISQRPGSCTTCLQGLVARQRAGVAQRQDVAVDQHHLDDIGAGIVDRRTRTRRIRSIRLPAAPCR